MNLADVKCDLVKFVRRRLFRVMYFLSGLFIFAVNTCKFATYHRETTKIVMLRKLLSKRLIIFAHHSQMLAYICTYLSIHVSKCMYWCVEACVIYMCISVYYICTFMSMYNIDFPTL